VPKHQDGSPFGRKGRDGDRINAVLAAAGFNFSLLRRWFTRLLRTLLLILTCAVLAPHFA
jgi:transposase, IS5 family